MALESATYISDLNISNPAGADTVGQADDHLRLLKAVLKNTFPNINGPVTATDEQLSNGVVPIGGIIMWSGSAASVPSGWKLCDGTTHVRTDGAGNITVPDLRSKFIQGSGASNASPTDAPTIGTTGGASSNTPTITVTNAAHAITQAELPSLVLPVTVTDPGHTHAITDPGHTHLYSIGGIGGLNSAAGDSSIGTPATASAVTGISINSNYTGITASVSTGGSGAGHTHANTAVSSAVPTLPPYYTLAFICKI